MTCVRESPRILLLYFRVIRCFILQFYLFPILPDFFVCFAPIVISFHYVRYFAIQFGSRVPHVAAFAAAPKRGFVCLSHLNDPSGTSNDGAAKPDLRFFVVVRIVGDDRIVITSFHNRIGIAGCKFIAD